MIIPQGRALDLSFLRFLMSVTWAMKTPAFRAKIPIEEFLRDRTEEEDKAAKVIPLPSYLDH